MEIMEIEFVDKLFWRNKKVFITGHTGFKGSWLCMLLKSLGSEVHGYALEPPTSPSLYYLAGVETLVKSTIGDIRDYDKLKNAIIEANPDILIHMAAQPLVRFSYEKPRETFEVNVMGTVNVLEALRYSNIKAVVNVTTDKVYDNKEWFWAYRENESLGGYDPYSSSKACSELVTSAYSRSFFQNNCSIATARAGNVIGGGDWSKDRLIPDIINSLILNKIINIRNPNSIRPWQHVLEPLVGYLMLAEKLYLKENDFSGPWNFGPNENDTKSVEWIVEKMCSLWGKNIGYQINSLDELHEANNLKLDCSKAINLLGWKPRWSLEETLESIIIFNTSLLTNQNVQSLCFDQIDNYFNKKQ